MNFNRFLPHTNYLSYHYSTPRQTSFAALAVEEEQGRGYPKMNKRVQKKLGRMFVEYFYARESYLGSLVSEISDVLLKCEFPKARLPEVYDFLVNNRAERQERKKSGGKGK